MFFLFVFTFLLYGGLNQIFLFCFLLLAVSTFALYLSLCLYPDLSKASWYGITESLKISSEEDNDESWDSMESGSCLMIDGGWLDSMFIYFVWLFFFSARAITRIFKVESYINFWISFLTFSDFGPLLFLKIAKTSSQ